MWLVPSHMLFSKFSVINLFSFLGTSESSQILQKFHRMLIGFCVDHFEGYNELIYNSFMYEFMHIFNQLLMFVTIEHR